MIRPHRGTLPTIHPSAFVDDSAQVIGDTHIGAESSVWMQTVIRGDVNYIRIGDRTNIQDGTIVHVQNETCPTVIGHDVTVGHGAIVHGCTIADRVLVGMGADDVEIPATLLTFKEVDLRGSFRVSVCRVCLCVSCETLVMFVCLCNFCAFVHCGFISRITPGMRLALSACCLSAGEIRR